MTKNVKTKKPPRPARCYTASCPTCGAPVGWRCFDYRGDRAAHPERHKLVRQARKAELAAQGVFPW